MKARKMLLGLLLMVLMVSGGLFIYNKTSSAKENKDFKICIDPGHQKKGVNISEPNGPGSSLKKAKVSSGTRGVATKKWEYEVNLDCALLLKKLLIEEDYAVILTRESNEVNISNRERALIGNDNNCNLSIKLHCDSVGNNSKTGASILIPSKNSKYTSLIYKDSYDFAKKLESTLRAKGIKVNGIFERNDLTGFNWSKIPVITLEMGFMSNFNEDKMLNDKSYNEKMMSAVLEAIKLYKEEIKE